MFLTLRNIAQYKINLLQNRQVIEENKVDYKHIVSGAGETKWYYRTEHINVK
jgi:hypothetical protein